MTVGYSSRLAWSLWVLALLLLPGVILQISLNWVGPTDIPFAVGFIAVQLGTATAGAIISSRLPGNAVGWIFLAIGLLLGLLFAVGAYAELGVNTGYDTLLPGTSIAAWIGTWIFIPASFGLPMFLLLLFPDGRFISRRWRLAGWVLGGILVLATMSKAFEPGRIPPGIENPLAPGGGAGEVLQVLSSVTDVLALPAFALAVAGLAVRLWRSRGIERQQLKWFAYSAALVGAGLGMSVFLPDGPAADLAFLVGLLALAGLPVAAGIAILRYRLYDIDVIVNRTLVYGSLTVALVALYVGSVVSLQYVFRTLTQGGSQLAVVTSTLVIAALFNSLRHRIQDFIDRRFYRRKYDAQKALSAFSKKLREETDLDVLGEDLVSVVRNTVQPEHVSLWLKPSGNYDHHRSKFDGKATE
ncbi:hypothetical protein BH18ACT11_BH18ACT11_18340 [soil metagenome]